MSWLEKHPEVQHAQFCNKTYVCMKLSRPPMTTPTHLIGWHRNCLQTSPCNRATICMHFQKSKHLLGSKVRWCDHRLAQNPKKAFTEVRVRGGTAHAQVDLEVDPPATCRFSKRRSFVQYGKGNGKKELKNENEKNEKVKLVRISHRFENEKTRLTARLPVTVSNVQTWSLAYVKKFCQDARVSHKPASAQRTKVTIVTSTRALVAVEPRRPPKTNVGTYTTIAKYIQKRKHLWGQRSVDMVKLE